MKEGNNEASDLVSEWTTEMSVAVATLAFTRALDFGWMCRKILLLSY